MKLSIKTSVLHHLTNAIAQTGTIAISTFNNHKPLQTLLNNKMIKKAKKYGFSSVEKYKEDKDKRTETERQKFFTDIQFVNNIKNKVTKVYTVTKTEEEVSIEINSEYITDELDWNFNLINKFIPLMIETIFIMEEQEGSEKVLKEKWELNTKDNIHTESKQLGVVYSYNGWDFVYDEYNTKSPLLLKDGETTVMVDDFNILNSSSHAVYNFNGFRFKYVLDNNKFSLSKYPESLQQALRAILTDHYKIEM